MIKKSIIGASVGLLLGAVPVAPAFSSLFGVLLFGVECQFQNLSEYQELCGSNSVGITCPIPLGVKATNTYVSLTGGPNACYVQSGSTTTSDDGWITYCLSFSAIEQCIGTANSASFEVTRSFGGEKFNIGELEFSRKTF